MNVIFVNSHPIQYFAPLYKTIGSDPDISLRVLYLSDETVGEFKDEQFGVNIKWDIPLLEGYESVFIKNNSWMPSMKNGFFGLINLGIVQQLRKSKRGSVVVVHGWAYFSSLLAIITAKLSGHVVCIRGESSFKHDRAASPFKRMLKFVFYRLLLFPWIDKFLYIGTQNRLFYKRYRVPDSKLTYTPYGVDNQRFRTEFHYLYPSRPALRFDSGISPDTIVILYSGKLIEKKRPMDLLEAVRSLKAYNIKLIMMGEGELRKQLEDFISENQLTEKVVITGFVNQTQVSKYYVMADLFVMCSEVGETWGLSVNEAMNFNLPLILSDMTGSSDDLVKTDVNGFVFETGDTEALTKEIRRFLSKKQSERQAMGEFSSHIVSEYSYQNTIASLKRMATLA